MFEVVQLEYEHVAKVIEKDPRCGYLRNTVSPETIKKKRYAYAALVDGEPIMLAGISMYWEGRGEIWAVIDHERAGRYFVQIHKAVKRFLDICPVRRIEAAVACDFVEGHRWIKMLGFTLDAERVRAYTEDGRDHTLYSLVKNG